MHKFLTIFFLFIFSLTAYSQSGSRYVKIKGVTVDPDNPSQVKIQYDLISQTEEDMYAVRLFLSTPSGERELFKFDKGSAIGKNLSPGINKTIFWKAADELTDFSQNVVFVIHAELTFTPIDILFPTGGNKFKRKQPITIKWKGGVENLPITISLNERGGETTEIVSGLSNEGEYDWVVGKKLKGKYSLGITQGEKNINTGYFVVKRKFSMFNRILIGTAVIGVGGYFYLMGQVPEPIEGPPSPPSQ